MRSHCRRNARTEEFGPAKASWPQLAHQAPVFRAPQLEQSAIAGATGPELIGPANESSGEMES